MAIFSIEVRRRSEEKDKEPKEAEDVDASGSHDAIPARGESYASDRKSARGSRAACRRVAGRSGAGSSVEAHAMAERAEIVEDPFGQHRRVPDGVLRFAVLAVEAAAALGGRELIPFAEGAPGIPFDEVGVQDVSEPRLLLADAHSTIGKDVESQRPGLAEPCADSALEVLPVIAKMARRVGEAVAAPPQGCL